MKRTEDMSNRELLEGIFKKTTKIQRRLTIMAGELDTLTTEVEESTTVQDGAILLLKGLSDQIAAMKNDPVKLQALADKLDAKSKELGDAIVANTPVA